jgi:hypothetical protein
MRTSSAFFACSREFWGNGRDRTTQAVIIDFGFTSWPATSPAMT